MRVRGRVTVGVGVRVGVRVRVRVGGWRLEVGVHRAAAKRFCCAKPETRAPSCNHMCATLQPYV